MDAITYSYAYWGGSFAFLVCNNCGNVLLKDWHSRYRSMKPPKFCDNCGRRIGRREKVSDERAARTLVEMCASMETCGTCPLYAQSVEHCESSEGSESSVLEWLEGEAE